MSAEALIQIVCKNDETNFLSYVLCFLSLENDMLTSTYFAFF